MKIKDNIKPISYFKAHAADVIKELSENRGTMIITQNGEAKAVVQDVRSYEELQASVAMLKLVAMGEKEIRDGQTIDAEDVFSDLHRKIAADEDALP